MASLGLKKEARLLLCNLEIGRDWSWTPEHVEAISMMLERPSAQDYVIATARDGSYKYDA
jgi:GDP-D-mannose dehydratase